MYRISRSTSRDLRVAPCTARPSGKTAKTRARHAIGVGGKNLNPLVFYGGNTMATKHPGFKNVAAGMAKKQGISKERASAELAASNRKASAGAKRKNPALKKVTGK